MNLVDTIKFTAFLALLRKIDWVVYAKEPFAGPSAVLAYLSHCTHRVAISNSRLIWADADHVTFRVKNYRAKKSGRHTTMTLTTHAFIRHYGFFGNGNRATNIASIRKLLTVKAPSTDQIDGDFGRSTDDQPRPLAIPCPRCGGRLGIIDAFDPL